MLQRGETPLDAAKRNRHYKVVNILKSIAKVSQYCVATNECTLYDKLVIYKAITDIPLCPVTLFAEQT